MTVLATDPSSRYDASPGAVNFVYGFKILRAGDLLVRVNGVTKVLGLDYAIDGVTSPQGSVTFFVPMVGGELVQLDRNMAFSRENDFQRLGDLLSATLNNDQDAPVMMIQQLAKQINYAVRFPDSLGPDGFNPFLPFPEQSHLLGWSPSAPWSLVNIDPTDLVTVAGFSDWHLDAFIATDGQATRILSASPGLLANIGVTIDGLSLTPGVDFTLSGTTVTFVPPLTDGQDVVIRFGRVLASGIQAAENLFYTAPYLGAIQRTGVARLSDNLSVLDFGADNTGVVEATAAFNAASATGRTVKVTTGTYLLPADVLGRWEVEAGVTFVGGGFAEPVRRGLYSDVGPGVDITRMRDRVFIGDGTKHTGNRFAPLGGTWLTERGANWFEKNSMVNILTTEEDGKFALLCANYVTPSGPQDGGAGLMAITVNDRDNSFSSRAGYFESFLNSNGGGSAGIEIQVGNYGITVPNPTPYGTGPGVSGITLGVEAGFNYVRGDTDIPVPTPTQPAGAAAIVGGGSGGASYRRWKKGIIFRDDSLFRGVTGTSGNGTAISMAQNHQVEWMASATVLGAVVRSDVTAVANQDVGIIFANNRIRATGTGEASIAELLHVATGVNFFEVRNAVAADFPSLTAAGPGADIGVFVRSKGAGQIRLQTHGTSGNAMFIVPPASAPVNYLELIPGTAGNPIQLSARGSDANIDHIVQSKGTGTVRLRDGGNVNKIAINSTGIGFFNVTPVARQNITGSRGGNAALADLLTKLALTGLITDGTTA